MQLRLKRKRNKNQMLFSLLYWKMLWILKEKMLVEKMLQITNKLIFILIQELELLICLKIQLLPVSVSWKLLKMKCMDGDGNVQTDLNVDIDISYQKVTLLHQKKKEKKRKTMIFLRLNRNLKLSDIDLRNMRFSQIRRIRETGLLLQPLALINRAIRNY